MDKQQLINLLLGELGGGDIAADSPAPTTTETTKTGFVYFTKTEINKMPKSFKKIILINGCRTHVRKRTDGRYRCSYEIYFSKKPYNNPPLSASGTTLEEAKLRFIEKLREYTPRSDGATAIPKDFNGFAMYWFENFHKRKVVEKTYDHDLKLYNRHIKAKFGKIKIKDINALALQQFLDDFSDRGKTAKDLHSIIKQILDTAVKHGLINLNPLGMCVLDNYEQEHGKALTYDEEQKLQEAYNGTEFELPIAIIRFTGLRPCEYAGVSLDGDFIKAQNGKREGGKVEYKRIPITPMLRPYLQGITDIIMPKPRVITNRFKKILPNHKLYDLRTTFQTRLTECHIDNVAIGLFMGNGIGGKLKKAYTDVSDEWLLKEGNKFFYICTHKLPKNNDN